MNHSHRPALRTTLFYVLLIAVTLFAAWLIDYCTRFAPSGFSDSAEYFSAARNFATGRGLGTYDSSGNFTRLTIFAPLYPLVLSLFIKFNIDPISASRVIDIVAFAALVFLSGGFLFRLTNSVPVALGYSLLLTSSLPLVRNFTSLMSEPLAISLGMIGFLLALLYVAQGKLRFLYLSAILSALAAFSRYAFLAFPVAACLVILFFHPGSFAKRLKSFFLYGLISIGPMFLWVLLEWLQRGSIGSRGFSGEALLAGSLEALRGIFAVAKYWLPYRSDTIPGLRADLMSPLILLGLIILVTAAIIFAFRNLRKRESRLRSPVIMLGGFLILFITYLAAIVVAYITTSSFPLNERILSPALPPMFGLILAAMLVLDRSVKSLTAWFSAVGSLLLVALFMAYYAAPIHRYSVTANAYPDGFASPLWKDKEIFNQIADHTFTAADTVFSNGPDLVIFYNNFAPHYLTHSYISGTANEELDPPLECRFYILFPPENIDRFQRREDPISSADIARLKSMLAADYIGEDGLILASSACQK